MELIENLLQLLTTFIGALLSGISYRKSRRQAYFLLLCFYGCFALGALYWTLYLLLFDTTPKVFYVSERGLPGKYPARSSPPSKADTPRT